MNPKAEFWIVMADRPTMEASKRHPTQESAQREARRLANIHGGRFFVLRCEGYMERVEPVQWHAAEGEGSDFPF